MALRMDTFPAMIIKLSASHVKLIDPDTKIKTKGQRNLHLHVVTCT